MRYICGEGCEQEVTRKTVIPGPCQPHGRAFYYAKALGSNGRKPLRAISEKRQAEEAAGTRRRSPGSTMNPGKGFEASPAQRTKVKGMPCLHCRQEITVDPAHVWPKSQGGCDHPDCVIPLCRSCHRAFDLGQIDLLPILADSEAWALEQAHPIAKHGVGLVELVKRLGGNQTDVVHLELAA